MLARSLGIGLVLTALLTACSGGGSPTSTLPQAPTSGGSTGSTQSVVVSIRIPASGVSSAANRRQPQYVSVNTQSAVIAINGGAPVLIDLAANSPNCVPSGGGGRTCTATVSAAPGADTFSEKLYASTDGSGPVLSQSVTTQTIVAGHANVVNMILEGVVATLGVALSNPTPPVGSPTQIVVIVTFSDSSGATIIGSDPFANPITLSDSDQSGITSLNRTTLTSPADAANVYLNYTGQPLASATITASAAGATSGSATLTPKSGPITFNDYTTFGYDDQRDVYNPNTTAITPAGVANLHLAWQRDYGDAGVQSQPVLATEIPGHAAVLFVTGASGNVYAFDGTSGAPLWSTPTGQEAFNCYQGGPVADIGGGGSVAYDPTSQTLYAVGNANSSTNGFAKNVLYHINAATGSIINSVNFGGTQAGPGEINFSHVSVTLFNGIAYVGTSSTCDISPWRGRAAAINTASMTLANTFFTVWDPQNQRGNGPQPWSGGGVWGWGGVSIDFSGNVVTGVGNTDNGTSNSGNLQPPFYPAPEEYSGYGESFMRLTPDLSTVLASNHPIPISQYGGASTDLDVNGTPAVFKPLGAGCDPLAALQAKSGALIIYDTNSINSGPVKSLQFSTSTYADGFLGDPTYSQATGLLYAAVAATEPPLNFPPGMAAINPGCGSPSVTWTKAFGPDATQDGIPRSVPAVSAGGVVFMATSCNQPSGLCPTDGNYGALWELDASTGNILNNGAPILYTNSSIRAPATIDGNWVYVVDTAGDFYGLTIDPKYPKIAARRRAVPLARPFGHPFSPRTQ
jgi:hypothetical protein